MPSPTPHPFSHLQSTVREWNAHDLLHPDAQSWERFQAVAPMPLSQILANLQQILEAEGIRTTMRDLSDETRCLGLSIDAYDIDLLFGPSETPQAFQFLARRLERAERYERRIPYRLLHLDLGHVITIVEEVLLRLLGPKPASDEAVEPSPEAGGSPIDQRPHD